MLIDDKSVKFVDEEVQLVFTLDLIMLLGEDFALDLGFPDLLDSWEQQNDTNYDND